MKEYKYTFDTGDMLIVARYERLLNRDYSKCIFTFNDKAVEVEAYNACDTANIHALERVLLYRDMDENYILRGRLCDFDIFIHDFGR